MTEERVNVDRPALRRDGHGPVTMQHSAMPSDRSKPCLVGTAIGGRRWHSCGNEDRDRQRGKLYTRRESRTKASI